MCEIENCDAWDRSHGCNVYQLHVYIDRLHIVATEGAYASPAQTERCRIMKYAVEQFQVVEYYEENGGKNENVHADGQREVDAN